MKSTNNEQTKGQKEETKETDAIKQYNIGTLKMYVSPQIIETNKTGDFKKKKLNKIYYVRKFTETPGELQQSQRLNAPPAAQPMARPIGQPGAAAAGPPQAAAQPAAAQRQPEPMANTNLVPKVGGLFGSNSINSPDTPSSPTSPNNYNQQPSGSDNILSPNSRNSSGENITNKANYDAEPFISSVIKFTNSGFPSTSSIKSRIDTFFNIKLFRAYLKKLGSPITLYDTKNKTILPKDVPFLNNDVEPNSATTSEKKIASDATGEIVIKTSNNEPTFIGSVYAFLFTKPTDQESRQQSDTSKTKTAKPSMLMIKEGDEYRLLGKKIDNAEKTISALGTFSQNTLSKVTKDETISKAITDEFTKKTGTTFPGTVSGTARTLLYTPKSLSPTPPTIDTKVEDLKAIINAGQVDTSRLNSIIQSSRSKASFESGDLVLVPIIDIYNVVMGNVSAKQLEGKISISPGQKNILKLTIELLQKQNVIPTLTGEQKKGANDLYDTKKRNDELLKLLSQETINEINSIIKHNIKFILNLLFSNKTAFIYMGNKYMIDYVDWDSTFKQLQKGAIQKYMMVGYYIDIEIFLEKLEAGKLPIDRAGTFLGSCTVKKARLNSSWKKDFLDQDWGKVADKFRDAFKPTTPFSITDIIPDVIKKTFRSSIDLMEPLNAGVNQISFVQYSFLGQDQLIEAFKLIDNSYAGVSWKNNQSWEKRKERLFTGMDNCNADVYCFQNIQCSMKVYEKIVAGLTQQQQSTLTSTENTVQSDRVRIYNNFVIEKLLDDDKDSTNHVAQIYKRYKNLYHFVYFFEQKCIPEAPTSPISTLVPDMDFPDKTYPTAVGNLTMVKIDKFEIREKFDIRMAPILNSRSGDNSSIKVLKPLWAIDKSFATITYCYFKGTGGAGAGAGVGTVTGASVIPPVSGMPGIPAAMPTSGVSSSRTLPGIPEFNVPTTTNDPNDDKLLQAEEQENNEQAATSDMVNDENENEGEDEGEDESKADNAAAGTAAAGTAGTAGTGSSKVQGVQGGGAVPEDPEEQDKPDEWYKNDDSENVGFGNVLNSSKNKSNTKQKAPPKQCEKLFDVQYVPSGQIFGIINIKLDAKKTLKQASSITPPISPMITKEEIEVLLIAAFVFRFRIRYLLSGHTDKNPVFFSGDFNFNETTKERAPATELLLLRSNAFKDFVAAFTAKYNTYGNSIIKFIRNSTILNYLYGGLTKRGRFNLTPKIYGSVSPLSSKDADGDFESAKSNQLIFKTRTLEFCPEEKMNILQSQEHKNGFPDFPNDVDPSNSNAIGGIFNVSTQAVTQQISAVKTAIAQQKNAANSGDIRSIISTIPEVSDDDDEEDFLPSISEKQGFSKVMSSSPAATLHPDVIRDGNDTTYSKENSFFESPYPELVHICPTGDTDFNYLTLTPMEEWNKSENESNVFSDHAPIKFVIDSTPDPSTGKHKCSAGGGGGGVQGGGGMEEMEEMEGGGENDIKLISWNIANQCIKTNGGFYNHKFDCESDVDCVESDTQYLQRLSNIAGAIETMMGDDSFDHVLVQEGPTTADKVTEFTKYVTTSNEFKIISSDIGTSQYSQFYLVIRQADNDTYLNSGLISNKAGKIFSSNNIAKQIYDNIISIIQRQTATYTVNDIDKDFSKIWFFINQTKKIIMITVHFPFPPNGSPITLMSQRQEQLYIFMNAIITAIRTSTDPQIARYRDFDIIFAGDFNINMLQKFPSTMTPTFLKCGRVPGQETLIYTNNENGPSSFGGKNDAEYNPTNIDFAIYYPKVTVKVVPKVSSQPAVVNRFGQQRVLSPSPSSPSSPSSLPRGSSSSSSPSSSPRGSSSPSSSSSSSSSSSLSSPSRVVASSLGTLTPPNPALGNIDSKIEQAIFKSTKDAATTANLQQNVSIIGTEYNPGYSNRDIMPPGSATVIDISSTPIYNIRYDNQSSTATTLGQSNCKVNYMIQASPAISGNTAELISTDTVTNSVMNSLILAGQKKAENVIIPFIGGEIFFKALQAIMKNKNKNKTYEKTDHAKTLVDGVVKYFTFIGVTQTPIKNIIFSPFGSIEVYAISAAISAAILENNKSFSSCNVTNSDGTMNIIAETISRFTGNKQINAIVNAANVELAFGSGISSMCNAAINGNAKAKSDLTEIKRQFIVAYNQYIKTPVTLPIQTKPTGAGTGAGTGAVRVPTPTPSNIPCGHIMCQEFNDKVKGHTYTIGQAGGNPGVHTVMLYNTPNDPTIKYWALLGKEHGGSSANMMNTIGGKIDHKYKGQLNFYCIIDNLIKEIGEEAKINLTPEQFNEIFKKNKDPNATSLADYFIYLRGGGTTTKGPTYVFYGIMGKYADREVLKGDIKSFNDKVVPAYSNNALPPAQREMFYLNLINFDYNAYSANGNKYSDIYFTVANPPALQDSQFLLSTAELKKNHPKIVAANKYSSGTANGHDFISFYAAGNMNTNKAVTAIFNELKQKQSGSKLPAVVPFVAPSPSPLTSSLASSLASSSKAPVKAPVKASGIVACPGRNTVRLSTSIGARATINNFINAQDGFSDYITSPVNYQTALAEIKSGRKTGHWIWYIIPSDTHFRLSDNSKFYGIGPNATTYAAGNKVLTTSEYLANPTLRCRYVEILTEIGKKLIDYNAQIGVYGLKDVRSKQFLIKLMGGGGLNEVDYDKLTNSVYNFYNDLVRLGYGSNVEIRTLSETLKYFYSNPHGGIPPPLAKAPVAAPAPGQAIIMDLTNIQSTIRAGKDNSIFLINGGSFNPPHNGHLKIFELAYNFLQNTPNYKGKKIYGIMVASTYDYIRTKGGMKGKPLSHIISNDERIKLCKLASDSYQWGNPNFNQNNIIIYSQAEVSPTGTIIRPLQSEGINNMFYLGGSDYYLSSYSDRSDYNIIYVMRAEDKGTSFVKIKNGKDQFPITPPPDDEKEVGLSSTVIRDQIVSLSSNTGTALQGLQQTIFREVGRGVYCELQKINYIQNKEWYGNLCSGGVAALPTGPKASIPVVASSSSSSSSSSYPFFSVPIQNPEAYCYQAAAFQLLFSINSIRTQARVYAEDVGSIAGNACAVLNKMVINRAAPNHLAVDKQINQNFLATSAIGNGQINTQQDSQEFLLSILNSLVQIDNSIKDEITFLEATYTFCQSGEISSHDADINMKIPKKVSDYERANKIGNTSGYITSVIRQNIMNIPQNIYNKLGILIGINNIVENKMFECPANGSTINSTIQQILNSAPNPIPTDSRVGYIVAGEVQAVAQAKIHDQTVLKSCRIITQKGFIKIPDPLKYICFYKRLLPQPNTNYTFATCKGLTINGIQFRLRGYISHFGSQKYGDIRFIDSQPEAKSGHYVYVGIENDRQVLYNDGSLPQYLADNNSEYITKGYVFLYERVMGSSGGVASGGVGAAAHGGNKTKKYNKSSTFVVNNKTRKGVMRESSSPKNKNKNVTHHFKIVRNGNNTRKQNKSKNKSKSKNLTIKLK